MMESGNDSLAVWAVVSPWLMFLISGIVGLIWYLIRRSVKKEDKKKEGESEEISAIKSSIIEIRNDVRAIRANLESLETKVDNTNMLAERHDDEIRELKRDIRIIAAAHKKNHSEELPLS